MNFYDCQYGRNIDIHLIRKTKIRFNVNWMVEDPNPGILIRLTNHSITFDPMGIFDPFFFEK